MLVNGTPHIEQQTIQVQRWVWTDGTFKVPAADLMSCIVMLLKSAVPVVIPNKIIENYLLSKNYIEKKDNGYLLINEHKSDLSNLGYQISDYIDMTFDAMDIGTDMKLNE